MKRNLTIAAILAVGIVALNGCAGNTAPETAKTNANQTAANQTIVAAASNSVNQSPANSSVSSNGATNNAVNNASTPIVTANNSAVQKPAPPTTVKVAPSPVVGSGGNDLFLFSQVRNALNADADLQNSVIVETKEGSVTLTGNVRSETLKTKAAQLVQSVKGVKSLKNNLRVAP